MREIKLKIDKKVDIEKIIKDYFKEINSNKFYERKVKVEGNTLYIFVYEYNYYKYNPLEPGTNVTTTNTIICTAKPDSTSVAIVLASDDKNDGGNHLSLKLRDLGFYIS